MRIWKARASKSLSYAGAAEHAINFPKNFQALRTKEHLPHLQANKQPHTPKHAGCLFGRFHISANVGTPLSFLGPGGIFKLTLPAQFLPPLVKLLLILHPLTCPDVVSRAVPSLLVDLQDSSEWVPRHGRRQLELYDAGVSSTRSLTDFRFVKAAIGQQVQQGAVSIRGNIPNRPSMRQATRKDGPGGKRRAKSII